MSVHRGKQAGITGSATNIHSAETKAIDALKKGLKDLQELCDVVADKFWDAREEKIPAPSTKQLKPDGEPRGLD